MVYSRFIDEKTSIRSEVFEKKLVFIFDGHIDLYVEISVRHRVCFLGVIVFFTAEFSHFFITFFCQFGRLADNF